MIHDIVIRDGVGMHDGNGDQQALPLEYRLIMLSRIIGSGGDLPDALYHMGVSALQEFGRDVDDILVPSPDRIRWAMLKERVDLLAISIANAGVA